MRVSKQYEGISSLTVLRNTRVVTLTFGGSECYDYRMTGDIPEGFTRQTPFYPFSFVLECNPEGGLRSCWMHGTSYNWKNGDIQLSEEFVPLSEGGCHSCVKTS